VGNVQPADQTFTIDNTGDALTTLSYTVSASVGGGEPAWLTVTPASGSLTEAGGTHLVTVTIDMTPGGAGATGTPVPDGSYSGLVTITDTNAVNSPQSRTVSLTMANKLATLCVSPTTLAFGDVKRTKTSATQTLTITNVGETAFTNAWTHTPTATNGTINVTNILPGGAAQALAGSASQTASISVTATGALAQNNVAQSGSLSIASTGAQNTPSVVTPITWTQRPLPAISLAGTTNNNFTTTQQWQACSTGYAGNAITTQTFTISNSGDAGSTLNYTITDNAAWMTSSPASGSIAQGAAAVTITNTASIGGLSVATHTATVTVTDTEPTITGSDTLAVQVTAPGTTRYLCVIGAGTPNPNGTGAMSYTVDNNNVASAGQVLTIRNAAVGGTGMPWTLIQQVAPPTGITITRNTPNSGTLTAGSQINTGNITVTVTSAVAPGTYSATLRATGTTAQGTNKDIVVTITVF
jgi:hypothetical protein